MYFFGGSVHFSTPCTLYHAPTWIFVLVTLFGNWSTLMLQKPIWKNMAFWPILLKNFLWLILVKIASACTFWAQIVLFCNILPIIVQNAFLFKLTDLGFIQIVGQNLNVIEKGIKCLVKSKYEKQFKNRNPFSIKNNILYLLECNSNPWKF